MYKPQRSKKQIELLNCNTRITVASGAVRSGKTYEDCEKFITKVLQAPEKKGFALFGKTSLTIKRNIIDTFHKILDPDGTGVSEKIIRNTDGGIKIFDKLVYIQGCNDKNATSKIKGMTLKYSLIDELTEISEEHYNMILSRHITYADAWIGCTTNPDSPQHWFYKKNKDLFKQVESSKHFATDGDIAIFNFTLEDNLHIPIEEKERIKRMYSGIFYQRNILGQWVIAEGLVCPSYKPTQHFIPHADVVQMIKNNEFERYIGGADWGYPEPTTSALYGMKHNYRTGQYQFVKIAELCRERIYTQNVIDWWNDKQMYLTDLRHQHTFFERIYGDGAEQDRITQCQQAGLPFVNAKKDRSAGFSYLDSLFNNDQLLISDQCKHTNDELQTCRFLKEDETGYREGAAICTKPDHNLDSDRYSCFSTKLVHGL